MFFRLPPCPLCHKAMGFLSIQEGSRHRIPVIKRCKRCRYVMVLKREAPVAEGGAGLNATGAAGLEVRGETLSHPVGVDNPGAEGGDLGGLDAVGVGEMMEPAAHQDPGDAGASEPPG